MTFIQFMRLEIPHRRLWVCVYTDGIEYHACIDQLRIDRRHVEPNNIPVDVQCVGWVCSLLNEEQVWAYESTIVHLSCSTFGYQHRLDERRSNVSKRPHNKHLKAKNI